MSRDEQTSWMDIGLNIENAVRRGESWWDISHMVRDMLIRSGLAAPADAQAASLQDRVDALEQVVRDLCEYAHDHSYGQHWSWDELVRNGDVHELPPVDPPAETPHE